MGKGAGNSLRRLWDHNALVCRSIVAIDPAEIWDRDYNLCPLSGYEIECAGWWEFHHIISRGKASKSPAQKHLDIRYNLIWVCHAHNFSRWADAPEAMQLLYRLQAERFGEDRVREYLDNLPWKVAKPQFSSNYLLS